MVCDGTPLRPGVAPGCGVELGLRNVPFSSKEALHYR
jgi:hypothetical protein